MTAQETSDKVVLLGQSETELKQLAQEMGMPAFVGKQMAQWLYAKGVMTIDEMTNISKANRERLAQHCTIGAHGPAEAMRSVDGTIKYLYRTLDGHYIETVYIPDGDRATLCVSSQVGCKMGCAFCMWSLWGRANPSTISMLCCAPRRYSLLRGASHGAPSASL